MARNTRHVEAPPEAVWDVLADARSYGDWVVGAYDIRDVEGDWPLPGARFHHTQGRPPLKLEDSTLALEADPPRRLVMEVRARPFVVGRVEYRLAPTGGGTEVTMEEHPIGGFARLAPRPIVGVMLKARNEETLRRLARLAAR